MMLADARLPTGAHTQSAGLEPALNAGMPVTAIPAYIRARLHSVTEVEAATAVVARAECLSGAADLDARLRSVDRAFRVRTISPALRETSALLGRGYARLLRSLWPDSPIVAALHEFRAPCRPVALGAAAALTGLGAGQLVRLIGYDDAQTIAAAALKLSAMDPLDATRWVLEAAPAIEALADRVADCTERSQIPAWGAPQVEQWAQIHAIAPMRLFRA